MRKSVVLALALLVLVGVCIWLWQRAGAGPEPHPTRTQDVVTPHERPALDGTALEGSEPRTAERPQPDAATAESKTTSQAPDRPRDGIFGTIRFEDGTKPKTVSFMVYRHIARGGRGGNRFEGKDGVFAGPRIGAGPHEIERVTTDEGEFAPTQSVFDLRAGASNEIVLRRGNAIHVRVVDAETRAVLADAHALKSASGGWPIGGSGSPGLRMPDEYTLRGERVHPNVDGLIEIPPGVGVSQWFFRAEGYAWRHFVIRHDTTTEAPIEVGLGPGGGVDLLIRGWHDVDRPVLLADVREHVERHGVAGSSPAASDRGQIRIEGLPEGSLTFFVARRGGFLIDKVYGSGRAEIVRSRVVPLTIELEVGRRVEKAPLVGTLTIPAEWGPIESFLSFAGVQDGVTAGHYGRARIEVLDAGKPWAFETDPLPAGSYAAWVRGAAWRVRVEHRPGEEIHLVVPMPVGHKVRIVDETGAAVPRSVCKFAGMAEGTATWRWEVAQRDSPDAFSFRVAPGTVRLRCEAPGFVPRTDDIDIGAGSDGTTVVELRQGAAARIRFQSNDRPVSAQGFRVWASSPGMGKGFGARGDEIPVEGLPPGTWTLKFKHPDEFEKPDDLKVELVAGETKDVVVDVVRVGK